jgi:hypothetical protein
MGQGRNPYQAVQSYRSSFQRAVSCVTPSVILASSAQGYRPRSEHRLALGPEEAVKLPGADISLSVQVFARVSEQAGQAPWTVSTFGYSYVLREPEGPEILAYHWHPGRRSPIDFPHLHLGAGSGVECERLQKAHIPTGLVELEDVLLLAIRELGVRPRRDDWEETLGYR